MAAVLLFSEIMYQREARRIRNIDLEAVKRKNEEWRRMCRACGGTGLAYIFGKHAGRSLARDMRECCNLELEIDDGLPAYLCGACLELLSCAVRFRDMCRDSVAVLRRRMPRAARLAAASRPSSLLATDDMGDLSTEPAPPPRKLKRRRNKNEPRVCSVCGKEFPFPGLMKEHYAGHFNEFPFKCQSCPYRSRTKGLLRTHVQCMHSEKRYICNVCGAKFSTNSNLKRHIVIHHTQEENDVVQCDICKHTLRNKYSLSKHLREVHTTNPPCTCDICGKQYKTKKQLSKHRSKAHNLRSTGGHRASYLRFEQKNNQHTLSELTQSSLTQHVETLNLSQHNQAQHNTLLSENRVHMQHNPIRDLTPQTQIQHEQTDVQRGHQSFYTVLLPNLTTRT